VEETAVATTTAVAVIARGPKPSPMCSNTLRCSTIGKDATGIWVISVPQRSRSGHEDYMKRPTNSEQNQMRQQRTFVEDLLNKRTRPNILSRKGRVAPVKSLPHLRKLRGMRGVRPAGRGNHRRLFARTGHKILPSGHYGQEHSLRH